MEKFSLDSDEIQEYHPNRYPLLIIYYVDDFYKKLKIQAV